MLRFGKGSPEEERKIEILKERIVNDLPSTLLEDQTLFYRFLKARDFNVDHAEAMLRKHLQFRKVYGMDDMESYSPPEHLATYMPESLVGYDKEGCVIRYLDYGNCDIKGLLSMFEINDIIKYTVSLHAHDQKKLIEQSKKLGKTVSQVVYILNMENLSLFLATYKKGIEYVMQCHKLFQDNLPEHLKAVYVINSSFYFRMTFPVIKHIYAAAVLKKVQVFEKTGWKEALLETIDADVLPAFLGGTKTDPDGNPLCESFIIHGKKVPVELYKKQSRKSLRQEDGVKKLIISSSSRIEIAVPIYEQNTFIEWEFEIEDRDILFALYYKDNSEADLGLEELIHKQRIKTELASEVGIFKCDKIGTYIIEFDNSYSWIRSKEIFYRIKLRKEKFNDL